jgi:hypothetical protein
MRTQLGVLIGGVLFAWLVVSYPAWRFGGAQGLQLSATAALLCLAPSVATFLWGLKVIAGSPVDRLRHAVLATLLRMAVVLGVGMALCLGIPGFERNEFWLWTAGFYLGTLALETVLLNRAPQAKTAGAMNKNTTGAGAGATR